MKNVFAVCSLNSSRSQIMGEFLKEKYNSNLEVVISSAGLNVQRLRADDKRVQFTKELAEKSDVILAADHDIYYKIRYNLLKNKEDQIKKVYLMRIPDVFYTHERAFLNGHENSDYHKYMKRIKEEPEFSHLLEEINMLTPKEASVLTEAIYTKELYSAHLNPNLRQDRKYPNELLYKTLEFRFPWISELIEK